MIYLLFFLGFVVLIKGADFLVEGSSNIAAKMGISDLIIGLTVISIGTSMPELIVNIIASLQGNSTVAIGNVFGSNIANLLLILGVTAMIVPLPVQRNTLLSEIPYSLAAILLIGFLANSNVWNVEGDEVMGLSQYDGWLIMIFFAAFFSYIFLVAKSDKNNPDNKVKEINSSSLKDGGLLIGGMIMLFFGGKWVVDGAIYIAGQMGMSEAFISLTLVALGTSLPELVTSLRAATKGSTDLAVGNVVGSNIFNALWILGLSSSLKELPFQAEANSDLLVVVLSTLLVILLMILSRKMIILKWHGSVLLIAYIIYNVYIFYRG